MFNDKELEQIAETINDIFFCDSHMIVQKPVLVEALRKDCDRLNRLPTLAEMEELVEGDEERDIERISRVFPATSKVIGDLF